MHFLDTAQPNFQSLVLLSGNLAKAVRKKLKSVDPMIKLYFKKQQARQVLDDTSTSVMRS